MSTKSENPCNSIPKSRVSSLQFANVVLLVSSSYNLQHAWDQVIKSETEVFNQKKVDYPSWFGGESLCQLKELKCRGVLVKSDGKMKREMDRCIECNNKGIY